MWSLNRSVFSTAVNSYEFIFIDIRGTVRTLTLLSKIVLVSPPFFLSLFRIFFPSGIGRYYALAPTGRGVGDNFPCNNSPDKRVVEHLGPFLSSSVHLVVVWCSRM